MRFMIVGKKIFTWDGKRIHERHSNRYYDPRACVGYVQEGDRHLPLNTYGDFGVDEDGSLVRRWEQDAKVAFDLLQTPDFMRIEVI